MEAKATNRLTEAEMNAEVALALTSCTDPGNCSPTCRHRTAPAEDVDAARRWIADHPWLVEAWRAQRLGDIDGMLRHWEAERAGASWVVRPLLDAHSVVVGGLTQEQADAIVDHHNAEVGNALRRLSWYVGV